MKNKLIWCVLLTGTLLLVPACSLQIGMPPEPAGFTHAEVKPTSFETGASAATTAAMTRPEPTDAIASRPFSFLVVANKGRFYGHELTLALADNPSDFLFSLPLADAVVASSGGKRVAVGDITPGQVIAFDWNGVMFGKPPYELDPVKDITLTDTAYTAVRTQVLRVAETAVLAFDVEDGTLFSIGTAALAPFHVFPVRGQELTVFWDGTVLESFPSQFGSNLAFVSAGVSRRDLIGAFSDLTEALIDEQDLAGNNDLRTIGIDLQKTVLSLPEQQAVIYLLGDTFAGTNVVPLSQTKPGNGNPERAAHLQNGAVIAIHSMIDEGDTLTFDVSVENGFTKTSAKYAVDAEWQDGTWAFSIAEP